MGCSLSVQLIFYFVASVELVTLSVTARTSFLSLRKHKFFIFLLLELEVLLIVASVGISFLLFSWATFVVVSVTRLFPVASFGSSFSFVSILTLC